MPHASTAAVVPPRAGPQAPAAPVPRRVAAAAVAGNALEFYDFLSYAFFAVYIGKAFFPAATPHASLLTTVAVFWVGFFTRPLGGLVFGLVADRAGRRPAMLGTIAMITVGTLGLAVTPSYERIGIAAPVLVVAARLVQGLALGGEVGPATAFLVEGAGASRRGRMGSWQSASQGVALVVAGAMGALLTSVLTPAQMQDWGWRVPFALALLALPFVVVLRRAMPETLAGSRAGGRAAPGGGHLAALARVRGRAVLGVLSILGGTVSSYVGNYMTTYAIATLKLSPVVAMLASVAVGVSTLVFALLGGWLSDRVGRKPVMIWPRLGVLLLAVPAFAWLVGAPSAWKLLATTFVLSALNALSAAPQIVTLPELFPARLRATGVSLVYAVGVSVFGGSTQWVVTWLIGATGSAMAPAWYLVATSLLTLGAMLALPETAGRPLDGE